MAYKLLTEPGIQMGPQVQATASTSRWLHPLQLASAVHMASSPFCITLHILAKWNGITDNHLHQLLNNLERDRIQ